MQRPGHQPISRVELSGSEKDTENVSADMDSLSSVVSKTKSRTAFAVDTRVDDMKELLSVSLRGEDRDASDTSQVFCRCHQSTYS